MSFFDETKNAGLLLVIIALLGIVFTAVAAFAFDPYKDSETWRKIVMILGAVVGSAVYAILGLDIMNGKARFQIGNLFSDLTSKFGVVVAITAAFGLSSIISCIFSAIAYAGGADIVSIIIGILFILMAWLLADKDEDVRKIIWIILLVLYILMLIVSIFAILVLIGIPMFLLALFLVLFLLSPEVKGKCGM